jgi:hypothetical protein
MTIQLTESLMSKIINDEEIDVFTIQYACECIESEVTRDFLLSDVYCDIVEACLFYDKFQQLTLYVKSFAVCKICT